MDNLSNNSKHKLRIPFSENSSSSRDSTSNNDTQWHENYREHRRDHARNRERGRDQWSRDKPPFHGKRDNSQNDDSLERFSDDQPQLTPTSYPAYTYPYPANDRSYIEYNHHSPSMMSYSITTAAAKNNPRWRGNAMDGVSLAAQNNMPGTSSKPTAMEMVQASGSNINPLNFMGTPGEFSMIGKNNYDTVGHVETVSGKEMVSQVKEVVHFSKGVLLPPNPNTPPPSTRGKPPGCKTIYVGGLPEKATEEMIKEIFEKSGEIESIRFSTEEFCRIRFKDAGSVERALSYSGYKLKIDNCDDPPFRGTLHVDYAVSRDDQRDYECYQRKLNRIENHKEKDYIRSATLPIFPHYTEHEAALLAEKLRNEETFLQAAYILINWLDRGECTKRNARSFYSMIQSTNSHVRRLIIEKGKYEEPLNDAKEMFRKQMEGITHQFHEIEKVFRAACLQKVWDHFSKAQRKNVELWKKQTEEIKKAHVEDVINEREDEEMDLSDDENGITSQGTPDISSTDDVLKGQLKEEIAKLREENNSLRSQLNASQQKIILLQEETEEQMNRKEQKISSLCGAITNTQKRCNEESHLQEFRVMKAQRTLNKDDENQVDSRDFDESCQLNVSQQEILLLHTKLAIAEKQLKNKEQKISNLLATIENIKKCCNEVSQS